MKKKTQGIAISALILFLFPVPSWADCTSRCCTEEFPRLVVNGEGRIETLADKAFFFIKLRTEEKKLSRAFELSTEKMNSISDVLSSSGIKKEDIQNLGYQYHPLYEGKPFFSPIQRPTSYEIIYTLKVTVNNLERLGKILAGLSEITETTVDGLAYTSTKMEELKREVLKKAAADARQKAVKLAEGSGAVLGKVTHMDTAIQEFPTPREDFGELRESTYVMQMAQQAVAAPQVESGYLEITGYATVTYALE